MKYTRVIIGLLVTVSITGQLCLPRRVYAAESISPISEHYVQEVLDYADTILSDARDDPGADDTEEDLHGLLLDLSYNGVAFITDTSVDVVGQSRSITDNTICLRIDLIAIEQKMQETIEELRRAYGRKSPTAILKLNTLLSFLRDRYESLVRGARDPLYIDSTWSRVLTAKQENSDDPIRVCPYHSDYQEARMNEGCNRFVLEDYTDLDREGIKESIAVQIALEKDYEDFLQFAQSQSAQRRQEHRYGCDGQDGPDGYDETPEEGIVQHALRSAFSLKKDHEGILENLYALRTRWSLLRLDDQQYLYSYDSEKDEYTGSDGDGIDALWVGISDKSRDDFRNLNALNQQEESRIQAKAVDSFVQVEESLKELGNAVRRLTNLATASPVNEESEQRGLRHFVLDFSYFLRRSCMFRPCNTRLDQVLKIDLADECFIYANGTYLDDGEAWKKCKEEVEK